MGISLCDYAIYKSLPPISPAFLQSVHPWKQKQTHIYYQTESKTSDASIFYSVPTIFFWSGFSLRAEPAVYSLLTDSPETWKRWSRALRCLSCAAQSMWRLCWTSPESCWVVAWRSSTSQSCPSRSVFLKGNFPSCPWLSENTAGTPTKCSLILSHQYLGRKSFLLFPYVVFLI